MTHKFAVGDRVRVTGNSNSHCHEIGAEVTLTQGPNRDGYFRGDNKLGGWLVPCDMEPVSPPQSAPEPWSIHTNTSAHGLLTDAQRAELQAWDGKFERYCGTWVKIQPGWACEAIYRATPKPSLTPDVIPWAALLPEWKWAARDEGGNVYTYSKRPAECKGMWHSRDGYAHRIDRLLSGVTIGTVDWKDSLQQRPENV